METELINSKDLKGGEFLVKETLPESVFIPEELDEDQKMIRELAKDFIEKEIIPRIEEIDTLPSGLNKQLLESAGEIGLLGTAIPEEYGGTGNDFNTNTAMAEELGGGYSFGVTLAAHIGIGTLPILYYGTKAQKEKYLPDLVSGKLKACYCLTEQNSGSDALSAKSTAKLSDDQNYYILNGGKMFITNAGIADVFIVFAKIDGEHFSAFIVDGNSEGLIRGKEESKMGIKGSSTAELVFDNLKIPAENLLGEIGKGHKIAFNILNIGRFKLCAMVSGAAKRNSSLSIKYANERKQFGKFISEFGAIKHKLAQQAIKIFVNESAAYRVSGLINDKIETLKKANFEYHEALMKSAEEYAVECAMLKVYGSEMLDFVVDETVQIHGGYGYMEEFPAARAYRDSRVNRIYEGTNEINRLLIIDNLLKRALKGKIDLLGPANAIQKELLSIPEFGNGTDGLFDEEVKAIKNSKKAALIIAGAAFQKFMQKMADEQEIIMNLSDILIDIFTSESALLRVRKLSEIKTKSDIQIKMLNVYISEAMERIFNNGTHAINSFASGDEQKMLLMGLKRFTKYKNINVKEFRREIANQLIEAEKYCF